MTRLTGMIVPLDTSLLLFLSLSQSTFSALPGVTSYLESIEINIASGRGWLEKERKKREQERERE